MRSYGGFILCYCVRLNGFVTGKGDAHELLLVGMQLLNIGFDDKVYNSTSFNPSKAVHIESPPKLRKELSTCRHLTKWKLSGQGVISYSRGIVRSSANSITIIN